MRTRGERGASAIEYALMVVAVGVGLIVLAAAFVRGIDAAATASVCDESMGYSCCKPDDPAYRDNCPDPSTPPTP